MRLPVFNRPFISRSGWFPTRLVPHAITSVGGNYPVYGIMSPEQACILFPIQCINKAIDDAKNGVTLYAIYEMLKSGDWSAAAKAGIAILYRSEYGHYI